MAVLTLVANQARLSTRRTQPTAVYSLRALGRQELPASLQVQGRTYRHVRTIKHDFWAATGFYDDSTGHRVVLKVSRMVDFAAIPFRAVGRYLCRREMHFYRRLGDLPNVPDLLGTWGDTGFIHDFVHGQPLGKDVPIPPGFFDRLWDLMQELHRRGIVYVDTNKPSNILVGNDGEPHLIDFQISGDLVARRDLVYPRWWLRHVRASDNYHILKHKRRFRPSELTEEEKELLARGTWLIRIHRFLTRPYFRFRRTTFKRMREAGRLLPAGSE